MAVAITRETAARLGVLSLGLDPTVVGLNSTEALSEVLRRVASFNCPATSRELVDIALRTTSGLIDDESLRERLSDLLEEIVNIGDLLELPNPEESGRLLYLAQPSFVARGGSRYLLLGVRSDGAPLAQGDVVEDVEPEGHARFLDLSGHPDPEAYLNDLGFRELGRDAWLRSPRSSTPGDFVAEYDARLEATAAVPMEMVGATLLDTATSVTYYKGRWRTPSTDTSGRYVGRRPRAYGSDIWMYAELQDGAFTRAIDLPVENELARGCDEAWRLQAALDRLAGDPQVVRVNDSHSDVRLLSVFSPLPSWAQRRLDMVGTPVPRRGGALMCYSIATTELEPELNALKTLLWMEVD